WSLPTSGLEPSGGRKDRGDPGVAFGIGMHVVGEDECIAALGSHALVHRGVVAAELAGELLHHTGIALVFGPALAGKAILRTDGEAGIRQVRRAADNDGLGRIAAGEKAGEHGAV